MNEQLELLYLKPSELTPYAGNARQHGKEDVAAIIASIREVGFCDPIGIWGDKNIIVEGHGRLMAANEMGLDRVPCIRLDHMTDEQRRAYALAHNKTAELSKWDDSLLAAELQELTIDMGQFGFDLSALTGAEEPNAEPPLEETELSEYRHVHWLVTVDETAADTYKPIIEQLKKMGAEVWRRETRREDMKKQHAEIELGHSAYTDNANLSAKVALRRAAIANLKSVRVLDLFAGDNLIWNHIKTDYYLGIDKQKGKGRNICADNRAVIPGLDLSQFTVIDCDAYGIPYEQIQLLYENGTMLPGTVIIYTCISGVLNRLCVRAIEDYGIQDQYKRSRVLYNPYSADMFHGMLYRHGVRTVIKYSSKATMNKEYGYFRVV